MLRGTPTLRSPDGERELKEGEVVHFPRGPEGAHQVSNRSGDVVRYVIAASQGTPEIVEYPDSGKIAAMARTETSTGGPLFTINRLADAVDYYDGENPPSRERLAEEAQQVPREDAVDPVARPSRGRAAPPRAPGSPPGPRARRSSTPTASPGGIRPSGGGGPAGSSALSRFVQSPPRQTRSGPITSTACSRWSIARSIVRRSGSIAIGCSIRPKTPSRSASARSCSSVRLRGVSLTARQPACVTQTRPAYVSRHSSKSRGEACERSRITPSSAKRASSLRPSPREAAVVGSAVRERVAPVPGQPGHPQAELPEEVGCRDLVAERLDALEGEHQPDPLAALDRVEIRLRPHRQDALGVLAHGVVESGHLAERLAQAPLRLELELDEDRADLKADAAGLEQRQPRLREHVRLAEPVLAVRELQQQVGVSVGEQPADYPFSDDRRRVHADVLRHQSRDGRGDRGGAAPRRRGDAARDRRGGARAIRPGGRVRRRSERGSCGTAPT